MNKILKSKNNLQHENKLSQKGVTSFWIFNTCSCWLEQIHWGTRTLLLLHVSSSPTQPHPAAVCNIPVCRYCTITLTQPHPAAVCNIPVCRYCTITLTHSGTHFTPLGITVSRYLWTFQKSYPSLTCCYQSYWEPITALPLHLAAPWKFGVSQKQWDINTANAPRARIEKSVNNITYSLRYWYQLKGQSL